MSFEDYLALIDSLLEKGMTTGTNQATDIVNFGRLNRQRMKRLEKTVKIDPQVSAAAKALSRPLIWLILTEGWCGDAAQSLPVIEKIAAESDWISTRYLLRDENLELMDRYLTDGGRAIPKLICLDGETLREIGSWGARPERAQAYFLSMKAEGLGKELMMENLQRWYLKDKERSIQEEFLILLKKWK
jgi:hypothetical protein